jgi:hypothetical protein
MAKRTHLFLDLEDTIIEPVTDGWHNTRLKNVEKVRRVISEVKPHQIHIFSFAIWDLRQLGLFETSLTRKMIEDALSIRLASIPTVDDDIIPVCTNVRKIACETVDFQEMSAFWGKEGAFRLNCLHVFKNAKEDGNEIEAILLDDDVRNENIEFPDLNLRIRLINIDTLEG